MYLSRLLPLRFPLLFLMAAALPSFAADKAVVKARAAFLFPEPDETTDIIKLLQRGTALKLEDKAVDDLDRLWFKVSTASEDSGWVESHDLKIVSKYDPEPSQESGSISKLTRRERMGYIKKHPELPRHTRKLIKDGYVGIDMTFEEVKAALGRPDFERTILLVKKGKLPVWIYRTERPVVIVFDEGKVSGWSEE